MIVAIGGFLLSATIADVSTLETAARPMMQAGVLNGCELDFKTAFMDNVYRQGATSVVNGALLLAGFNSPNKNLVVVLKTRIFDLTGEAPNSKQTQTLPFDQFVMLDDYQTNRDTFINSTVSEDGGRLSVYRFDDSFSKLWGRLEATKSMTISFNRHAGGNDVVLPINFKSTGPSGSTPTDDFNECVNTGLDALKKRLPH